MQQDVERAPKNQGSIYRSYKERIIIRMEDKENVPGPGSYNLPESWPKRKPYFPTTTTQDVIGIQLLKNHSIVPSIPNQEGKLGYSLKDKELIRNLLDQDDLKGISAIRSSTEEKNKGVNFSKSKVKRKVFLENGVTSLVDYPRQEVRLSYKCKKSHMFEGDRMPFESNSEKVLKKLFCGDSDIKTPSPNKQEVTPGPGSYNLTRTYQCQQRTERQHSLPFISGVSRQAFSIANGPAVGPASYHVGSIRQSKGIVSSFKSTSRRATTLGKDVDVPSVGSYHIKRSFDDCVKSVSNNKIKEEGRVWYKAGESSPGPAFYYPDCESIAWNYLYVYQPQPNFRSNVQREIFDRRIFQKAPGPGTYENPVKNMLQDGCPAELLPIKMPFLTNEPRFKPMVKEIAPQVVENQNQKKHEIHSKASKTQKPFLSAAKRFKEVTSEVPAPGSYYDMKKNFGEWSKTSYNLLFNEVNSKK